MKLEFGEPLIHPSGGAFKEGRKNDQGETIEGAELTLGNIVFLLMHLNEGADKKQSLEQVCMTAHIAQLATAREPGVVSQAEVELIKARTLSSTTLSAFMKAAVLKHIDPKGYGQVFDYKE